MNSLRLSLLFERVFSFDSENRRCLSVLRVSLKSFIVMSELEEDTIFWLSFSFLLLITFLHQFWITLTLPIIYLASSIYFLVMKPLKTFWILIAALTSSGLANEAIERDLCYT